MLFPGQAAPVAEVAGLWWDGSSFVRALVQRAADAVGLPVSRLLHGSGEALRRTENYQPVTVALCVGIQRELASRGIAARVVAGHSLGEIAACAAAGALSAEAAVELAAVRGRLMARAASRHPGGMVAVRAANREAALELARHVAGIGRLELAAHNAADEFVLSGPWPALRSLPESCHPTALATGGPWHSIAMEEILDEYREALRAACLRFPPVPLVCNATGRPLRPGDDLESLLTSGLRRPVEWLATLQTFADLGVRTVICAGPAKALRRLAQRFLGAGARVLAVEKPQDLAVMSAEIAK